jgi:hypothetical protein
METFREHEEDPYFCVILCAVIGTLVYESMQVLVGVCCNRTINKNES